MYDRLCSKTMYLRFKKFQMSWSHEVHLAALTESIVTVLPLENVGRSCYCIHGNTVLNEIYPTKCCAFCCMNLLHFSVVSTALLLEMTECKCHGL